MKTSFYFVLWIIIYPILGLFNNQVLNDHSFIIALIIVFILSILITKLMPNIITYETSIKYNEILEAIHNNNIKVLKKHIHRDAIIEIIGSIYFAITVLVLLIAILIDVPNQIIPIIVFAVLLINSIKASIKLLKAKSILNGESDQEMYTEIIEDIYKISYSGYLEYRENREYSEMFIPRPKLYTLFSVLSLIIAIICVILSLFYLIYGTIFVVSTTIVGDAVGSMFILYGSLALYFGIKDIIECSHSFKSPNIKNM